MAIDLMKRSEAQTLVNKASWQLLWEDEMKAVNLMRKAIAIILEAKKDEQGDSV